MDRLVDHLFIFEGDGHIRDFNGTHAEYRAIKRMENQQRRANAATTTAAPAATAAPAKVGLSNTERNEMKRLEKDMATLEQRKKDILKRFDDAALGAADAARLSTELGTLQEDLDTKEMRWLELAEKA